MMMSPAPLHPLAASLAQSRAQLLEKKRWLAPNSKRARAYAAEIRRLAIEELRLEVLPPAPQPDDEPEDDRRDPMRWWDL